jgi:EAL domain-containing protein (putative c-di-GMP-specific phosphodiesterase class I)
LLAFARETGSTLVAEGVETREELEMLRALGVQTVQGYLLGRPQSLNSVLGGLRGETADRRWPLRH